MTKHPNGRADRLKIKKIKFNAEAKKESSGKVRRQIKTRLEDEETEDEMRRYFETELSDQHGSTEADTDTASGVLRV